MARVWSLLFGFLVVLGGVCVSSSAIASAGVKPDQGAALSDCSAVAAAHSATLGGGYSDSCKFSDLPASGYAQCPGHMVAGEYQVIRNDGHNEGLGIWEWCVPADCSVYDSGSASQQWETPYSDGDVRCSDGCMGHFHGADGISSIAFPDGSGGSWGHFTGDGNRCESDTDASLLKRLAPGDLTCDQGQLSCYSPSKGFCATTESGEMVCVSAPPAGQGSCASGATGSNCAGNGVAPPSPPDPPIAKNTPPDQTSTATGKDAAGNTYNYTTNNYSGTSPGPGPSSSSADQTSGTSGSNENASGNSPGPGADHGTDANGKCPDGSVPTASGCSGTAADNGCDSPPQCFGDAVMCASFREQVAIRCNTAKAAGGSSSGTPTLADVPGALAAAGVPSDGGASGDPSTSGLVSSSDLGEDGFDVSGLGFSRTCPADPVFDVLGHSYTLDLTPFCNFAGMLGWFVLLVAFLVGLRVVATGRG